MVTTEEFSFLFHSVAQNAGATMTADRCQLVNRAFKAVEGMGLPVHLHLEGVWIVIPAGSATCHDLGCSEPDRSHVGLWFPVIGTNSGPNSCLAWRFFATQATRSVLQGTYRPGVSRSRSHPRSDAILDLSSWNLLRRPGTDSTARSLPAGQLWPAVPPIQSPPPSSP